VRRSVGFALALLPAAVGVWIGSAMPRWSEVEVEIAADGKSFRVAGGRAQPLPGLFTVDRDPRVRLRVTNRDTTDRLVGVAVAPAGQRVGVPAQYCSVTDSGPQSVVIIR
jgi:hypothetical protein